MGSNGWRGILSVGPTIFPSSIVQTHRSVVGRKQEVYTMQWKIKSLSDYVVSGARYGGPIGKYLAGLIASLRVNEHFSKQL